MNREFFNDPAEVWNLFTENPVLEVYTAVCAYVLRKVHIF